MVGNWSAVIVNYNGATFLEFCLFALREVALQPHQTIVVDNASTDDSLFELNGFPEAVVLPQEENLGFAGGANLGLTQVETDYAVVMNPDVEVNPDFGNALVGAFDGNRQLGATGALLLYPDRKTVQHAGGILERPLLTTRHRGYREQYTPDFDQEVAIDFATGAALGVRMAAVREVGGFDESLTPVYYEDVDLCTRLRTHDWDVRLVPDLRAIHYEGVTLQRSTAYYTYLHRNRLRYALKHLSGDVWRREFVPAEIARLRGEFQSHFGEDWPAVTGAGAIDSLLRMPSGPDSWGPDTALQSESLSTASGSLAQARQLWDVQVGPLRSRIPLVGRFRNFINNLGPRWYVDSALAGQRAFNEAVVQTLDAQDRINREQMATTLLYALIMLERLRTNASRQSGRTPEW